MSVFLSIPSVTLPEETEWPETIAAGWNILAENRWEAIIEVIGLPRPNPPQHGPFGEGDVALRIARSLMYLNEC